MDEGLQKLAQYRHKTHLPSRKKEPRRTTPTTLANQKSLACIDRHVRLSSARGEIPLKLFVKSSVDGREDQ